MEKLMHIVGNRPQFIKLAPVSREIRNRGFDEIIVHTGQHYDKNMSDVFFQELEIPKPDMNLGIGSGTHAEITAKAMIEIEKAIIKYNPKSVILYGDTNTTLAAAVVCGKLNIPIAHVEAGSRSYNKMNPEEQNRIITDHLSSILFCSDKSSEECLYKENIKNNVYFSGDVMYDTFLYCSNMDSEIMKKHSLNKDEFILMTWHRQENTDNVERVNKIVDFICSIDKKIIFPIHPRTRKVLENLDDLLKRIESKNNILLIEPIGYIEMVKLTSNCSAVLTDSGGLSKESFFGGAKCYFMLDLYSWPELSEIGWINYIDFSNKESIEKNINEIENSKKAVITNMPNYYGKGDAAKKIVDVLVERDYL